ncbi:far-red-elongated hypocotyl1-like protein [Tasmannia lanceolata]|uniref:far-red-elongated hypocotyl1-like protein n=1 Tax=Tasmannia lanceolata TaxID=3420 RepID=UPI0040647846
MTHTWHIDKVKVFLTRKPYLIQLKSDDCVKMGEYMHNPYEIGGFQVVKVPANNVDLTKKRKLQAEQGELPLPKHKFRDRSSDTDDIQFAEKKEENPYGCTIKGKTEREVEGGLEQSESMIDSNVLMGESDTSMPIDAESKLGIETGKRKMYYHDQPSTSSGSCSNNFRPNLEDVTQFEPETPCPEDKLLRLGMNYAYDICSEFGVGGQDQCLDVAAKEMLLYSNEAPSNFYVLSSGRWGVNHDARAGTKKPTIDKEFEQYFSSLML